jgi:sulfite reductase (NADPH) flavoprotein alpha-component
MSTTAQRALLKRVLFRLHWIAGITAGLVLGVVGFTGGLLGGEEPILRFLNPQLHLITDRAALPPDRWIAAARAAYPASAVRSVAWDGAGDAVRLRITRDGGRGIEVAIDPQDGRLLGVSKGADFFAGVEQVHRTLAAGPAGKQIVGASVASLLLLIATGLYLRWPRRRHSVSAWLQPNLRASGRGLLWQLHAVAGTWLLLLYLAASLTGLWWSYDFYRNAVNAIAGVPVAAKRSPPAAADKAALLVSVDRAWATFRASAPDATRATFAPSTKADAPLEIRYQTPSSAHDRAWNTLKLDPASGAIVASESYADLPPGRRFIASLFPLHSGSFFGTPGRVLMASAALLMPFFSITGFWLWLLRRRNNAVRERVVAAARDPLREPDSCPG